MVTKKAVADRLATVPLFERCTKRDLRAVARHLEVISFPAGMTVIAEGDHGETFFLVMGGEVEISQGGTVTARLGPGAHFGELALLDPGPRSATVVATADVDLAALSVRMFRVLLRDMPQLSTGLLASLAVQLRRARVSS